MRMSTCAVLEFSNVCLHVMFFLLQVVLVLEGGYTGPEVAEASLECLKSLLGDPGQCVDSLELRRPPCPAAVASINTTIGHLVRYCQLSGSCQNISRIG